MNMTKFKIVREGYPFVGISLAITVSAFFLVLITLPYQFF